MKNFNFKKTLISLVLGLALVLTAIPTNLTKLFPSASAEVKKAYNSPAKVEINGTFETSSSVPEKWNVTSKYEDIEAVEGNDDKDSTSFNGIVSTNMSGWNTFYEDLIDDWIENWDKTHASGIADSKRETVADELKDILMTSNPLLANPLTHNYNGEDSEAHRVLAMLSGSTFTKYLNADESALDILNEDRKAFITYSTNNFALDQYSFYKITFYVKTTDGAKLNVSISGDIEKDAFTDINTATPAPQTHYLYSFYDGANTSTFYSTTAPTSATLTHSGNTYKLDGDEFVADTTDPDSPLKSHKITYKNESVLASSEGWEQKTIYISTTTDSTIRLNFSLGSEDEYSTGNAFFDEVEVTKIQLLDFYKNAVNTSSISTVDNREILKSNQNNADSRNYTELENFEDGISWTASNVDLEKVDLLAVEEGSATGFEDTFPANNASNNNLILKVNAHDTSNIVLNSDKITLAQGRYYRISFWATSSYSNAKLTAELIGTKADGATASSKDSGSPYITSRNDDNPSDVNNFWTEYIYYVRSTAEMETEAYLKITVNAGQVIYFDNLVIENVTKFEFDNSKSNKIDLATTIKNEIVLNGNFFNYNTVDIENYIRPLPPANWTNTKTQDVYEFYKTASSSKFTEAFLEDDTKLSFNAEKTTITYDGKEYVKAEDSKTYNYKEGDKIVSRFVLMEDQKFEYDVNKSAYCNKTHNLELPTTVVAGIVNGTTKASNILKITTSSKEATTYKSALFKLSSTNAAYIIAIDIKTDIATRANIRLVDTNGNVYSTMNDVSTYDAKNGTTDWKTVKFYVGTGLETADLFLELEFVEAIGTIEFKNIYGLKTTTTSIVDNKLSKTHDELQAEGIRVVNLAKETFIEHADKVNSTTHLYDANLYEKAELSGKTSGIFGILDTSAPHSDFASITAKDVETSPYVLVIKNNAGESTQINSIKSFTVAKSKALQLTITARVEGLTEGKYATISFGDLDASFEVKSNEFTEYTLYIDNTESDKASLVKYYISMLETAGTLVIDNVTVTSLNNLDSAESTYPDGDTETVKFVKTTLSSETEEEKEETKDDLTAEDENNALEIFLAVFSSLLLVASIAFALVYTRVKALHKPRKRREKNLVNETDDGQKGFV